jgi:rhomboid family GlyGly-CTERM serine protease
MCFSTLRTVVNRQRHPVIVLGLLSLLCIVTQLAPLSDYLTWDKQMIAEGQWWRIVTGNFTHTNFVHLGMNLAALWLIVYIFKPTARALLAQLFVIGLIIGIGLFQTDIYRYVGLSGILHGLFAYGALHEALAGRRTSWLLVLGVSGKVIWEQSFGASPMTVTLIDAPVAIQAHLIGLLAGFGLCLGHDFLLSKRLRQILS